MFTGNMKMLRTEDRAIAPEVCFMNSSTLRQLWTLIGETQASTLLKFGDAELVQQLLRQLQNKIIMSGEEVNIMNNYLNTKVSLIRDLAQAGLV
jgi:hypothetical protein